MYSILLIIANQNLILAKVVSAMEVPNQFKLKRSRDDLNERGSERQNEDEVHSPGRERNSKFKLTIPSYENMLRCSIKSEGMLDRLSLNRGISIDEKFNSQIEISPLVAWILLFANIVSAAVVPCWLIADVHAEPLTRNSWRFLMVSFLLIPFVLYEYRMTKLSGLHFRSLFSIQNMKANFVCSINACLWVCICIYACKLTSITHAIGLIKLKCFAVTLLKFKRAVQYHQFQIGGTILVAFGMALMVYDSATLEVTPPLPPQVHDSQRYLHFSNLERILGDLLAFSGSFVSALLDQKYIVPTHPRFTNLFIFNIFLAFNFISFGYFFGGSQFTNDINSGVFGLFRSENFVGIFYVAIMLGLNLLISRIMIDQMFSNLIKNVGSSMQSLLTCYFCHLLSVELTHSGYTALGFGFMVPGMILIVGGQSILINHEFKVDYIIYRPTSESLESSDQPEEMPLISRKQSSQSYNVGEATLFSSKKVTFAKQIPQAFHSS